MKWLSFTHCMIMGPLLKIILPYIQGFISGLSILFHQFILSVFMLVLWVLFIIKLSQKEICIWNYILMYYFIENITCSQCLNFYFVLYYLFLVTSPMWLVLWFLIRKGWHFWHNRREWKALGLISAITLPWKLKYWKKLEKLQMPVSKNLLDFKSLKVI